MDEHEPTVAELQAELERVMAEFSSLPASNTRVPSKEVQLWTDRVNALHALLRERGVTSTAMTRSRP